MRDGLADHEATTRGRNVRPCCHGKSISNSSCYSRFSMPAQLAPGSFSLGAVFCWGTSDFLGGVATRRASTFLQNRWPRARPVPDPQDVCDLLSARSAI